MDSALTREEIIAELRAQECMKVGKSDHEFTSDELLVIFSDRSIATVVRLMGRLISEGRWAKEERIIDGRRRWVYWRV